MVARSTRSTCHSYILHHETTWYSKNVTVYDFRDYTLSHDRVDSYMDTVHVCNMLRGG
jgi:hypothetical protein